MKSGKEKFQFRLKKDRSKKAERASKRRGTASIAAYSIIWVTVRRRRKDQIISSTVNIDISRQNALSKWKSWATPILLRKA